MIDKITYQYKISPRYFLYLLIPIFIGFVLIFSAKYYKNTIAMQIFGTNHEKLKISIQLGKVPDVKFIGEDLIENILNSIPFRKISYIQPNQGNEIITLKETNKNLKKTNKKEPPKYEVKFIYIGVGKKYALIGGNLLTEGDITSENEKIIKIEKNKILLEGDWGRRWIYLINIQR